MLKYKLDLCFLIVFLRKETAMSVKTVKIIYLVYGILLSLLLVTSGILLMISCVNIYNLGSRPFTPESISSAFDSIKIIIFITLGAVAAGAVLKIFLPLEESFRGKVEPKVTLARLKSKNDLSSCTEDELKPIKTAGRLTVIFKVIAASLCALLSLPALIIAVIPTNYTSDYNQSIINLSYLIIPTFLISAVICIAYVYVEKALIDKQVKAIKMLIAAGKATKIETVECSECKCKKERYAVISARIIILVLSVVFIALGITNGGMADVLSKAINICTECIGLG